MKAEEVSLQGKAALVTGGNRGIGRAVVQELLEEGMGVWATSRKWAPHAKALEELRGFGGAFHPVDCDSSEPSQIQELFREMQAQCPQLFLLVNNAGIGLFGPSEEVSVRDWDHVMDVNARGTFLFSREAFRWMKATGGGRIINISSVVGLKGYAGQSVYTASKHAVVGITKVMAREGQRWGIRASVICPGGVDTELASKARPDLETSDLIKTADVARAVLYLAKEPASCCTDMIQLRRGNSTPFA